MANNVRLLQVFDKVVVLYEGEQIYFGPTGEAREFFTKMGFDCPSRQTTADFLTSLTSPTERRVKPGYEAKVPRTPAEFAQRWQRSQECARLLREIDTFDKEHPIGGQSLTTFSEARRLMQSKRQSVLLSFYYDWFHETDVDLLGASNLPTHSRFSSRSILTLFVGSSVSRLT